MRNIFCLYAVIFDFMSSEYSNDWVSFFLSIFFDFSISSKTVFIHLDSFLVLLSLSACLPIYTVSFSPHYARFILQSRYVE